jgi:hypothetical protein
MINSRPRVQILPFVQSAVACRLELHASMNGNKDLLYLDLALENVVRAAVERGIGSLGIGANAFVGPLLQNLVRHFVCFSSFLVHLSCLPILGQWTQ